MTLDLYFIHGMAVGIEYVEPIPEEDIPSTIVLDLFIVRLLFQWTPLA